MAENLSWREQKKDEGEKMIKEVEKRLLQEIGARFRFDRKTLEGRGKMFLWDFVNQVAFLALFLTALLLRSEIATYEYGCFTFECTCDGSLPVGTVCNASDPRQVLMETFEALFDVENCLYAPELTVPGFPATNTTALFGGAFIEIVAEPGSGFIPFFEIPSLDPSSSCASDAAVKNFEEILAFTCKVNSRGRSEICNRCKDCENYVEDNFGLNWEHDVRNSLIFASFTYGMVYIVVLLNLAGGFGAAFGVGSIAVLPLEVGTPVGSTISMLNPAQHLLVVQVYYKGLSNSLLVLTALIAFFSNFVIVFYCLYFSIFGLSIWDSYLAQVGFFLSIVYLVSVGLYFIYEYNKQPA